MTGPGAGTPTMPSGHRAHLDGVRVVAVYLVILFHAGLVRFGGGHVGVDVFFVLSGYLVTGVLLREIGREDRPGHIRFGRFYARRARRLLPAALVCLVVTAVAFRTVASGIEVAEAERGFQAAAVYLTNWYLIDNATSYFAADVSHSPILHFWSLAVEEQFYLAWPLLFAGLALVARRVGRHGWNVARGLVLLGVLTSAGWAFSIRATDPNRAYYGTDTRAYQLLLGALLALTPGVIVRLRRAGALNGVLAGGGVAALVAIAVWGTRTGPIVRGMLAAAATAALIAALETGRSGVVGRVLSWRPIEYLGQISYGTYLWHWPVIVLALVVDPDLSPIALASLSVVVGTGIASLSYQLLEHPIRADRRLDRIAWPVAVTGLALSLLAGALVLPRILERSDGGTAVASVDAQRFTPVPDDVDLAASYDARYGGIGSCARATPECTTTTGTKGTVVLMGDSNAQMWIPAFTAAAESLDLTLVVLLDNGCAWQKDTYRLTEGVRARCRAVKPTVYAETIPELQPDLIVLAEAYVGPYKSTFSPRSGEMRRMRDDTEASISELRESADQILIIDNAPRPVDQEFNPLQCLGLVDIIEACRFLTPAEGTWLEEVYREVAAQHPDVTTADFDPLICPFTPICDPMIGGVPVFWNNAHITEAWSRSLGPDVADFLVEQQLVPR